MSAFIYVYPDDMRNTVSKFLSTPLYALPGFTFFSNKFLGILNL